VNAISGVVSFGIAPVKRMPVLAGQTYGGIRLMTCKRQLIEPRQSSGAQADVGRSLNADNNRHSGNIVPNGQGDKSDRKKK
jgi:hypothetical protein